MQPSYEITDILKEVRTSGCLGQSQRQAKLFEFLLTESFHDRHHEVTQYGIAVDILDREESFDASSDSIVRVEMHRLRSNLKKFNAVSLDFDLHIPRASYQVVVRPKSAPLAPGLTKFNIRSVVTGLAIASVIFLAGFMSNARFDILSPRHNRVTCSEILPNVFLKNGGPESELQNYVDRVIRTTLKEHTNLNFLETGQGCANEAAPSYLLDYLVFNRGDISNVSLSLTVGKTEASVNFNQITVEPSDTQDDIYYNLTKELNKIAKPYGIIGRNASTLSWSSPDAQESFKCLVFMYDSFASDNQADFRKQHACLEKSVTTNMHSLDNKGGLAASYLQISRESRGLESTQAFDKAVAIIDDVGENWVNSAEMVIAKLYHENHRQDFIADRLRSVISVADTKFNSHAILQLYVGQNYGFTLGDWEKSKKISDRFKRMAPDRDQSTHLIDAAYALLNEPPEELMETCQKVHTPHSIISNVLLRACAIKARDTNLRSKAEQNLAQSDFDINRDLEAYLDTRNIEPALRKALMAQ